MNDVGSDCCGIIVMLHQMETGRGLPQEEEDARTREQPHSKVCRGGWPERTIPESIWVRGETNSGGYGCGEVGAIKQNYRLREFVACVC